MNIVHGFCFQLTRFSFFRMFGVFILDMIDNSFPGKHQQTNKQTSQHPSALLKHESNFRFEIELCFVFVLGRSNTTRMAESSR